MKLNGKELKITPASFEDAKDLEEAVINEIIASPFKIDMEGMDFNKENIFDSNVSSSQVTSLLKSVLSIAKSKQIKACLFKCSERAVLGDQKITPDFFEELENRGLYYKIMLEVLKVNLIPFYKRICIKKAV